MATKRKTRVMFRMSWGKITSDQFGEPIFHGNPDAFVKALIRRHQTAGALGIIDGTLKGVSNPGGFWLRVKEVIDKQIKLEAAAKLGKG